MKVEPLSVTYARALVELATHEDRLRKILEEVRVVDRLFKENQDFRTFVESPAINSAAKQEALERTFRGKLDDLLVDFLGVVMRKKRQFLLPEIFAEFEVLYDEAVGRVHVEATTAVPMGPEGQEGLSSVLEKKLKRTVVLVNNVRPEILGGLVIRYGDLVADQSVQTQLEKIRNLLKSQKPGSELVHENQS